MLINMYLQEAQRVASTLDAAIDEMSIRIGQRGEGLVAPVANGGGLCIAQAAATALNEIRGLATPDLPRSVLGLSGRGETGADLARAVGSWRLTANDLVLAISSSGQSHNVALAILEARRLGVPTLVLTGETNSVVTRAATSSDKVLTFGWVNDQQLIEDAMFGALVGAIDLLSANDISAGLKNVPLESVEKIEVAADATANCFARGGGLYVVDLLPTATGWVADHFAHNMNWDFNYGFDRRWSSVALARSAADLTGMYNDGAAGMEYELAALGMVGPSDVVVCLSTGASSHQASVVREASAARGATTVMVSPSGGVAPDEIAIGSPHMTDLQLAFQLQVILHAVLRRARGWLACEVYGQPLTSTEVSPKRRRGQL